MCDGFQDASREDELVASEMRTGHNAWSCDAYYPNSVITTPLKFSLIIVLMGIKEARENFIEDRVEAPGDVKRQYSKPNAGKTVPIYNAPTCLAGFCHFLLASPDRRLLTLQYILFAAI